MGRLKVRRLFIFLTVVLLFIPVLKAATIIDIEVDEYPTYCKLTDVAWNPNGTFALAVGFDSEEIRVYEHSDNTIDLIYSGKHEGGIGYIAWHPSGDYALITCSQELLKYESGIITVIENRTERLHDVEFAPDGSYALMIRNYYNWSSKKWENLLQKYDGYEVSVLKYTDWPFYLNVEFSVDGSYALILAESGEDKSSGTIWKYDGSELTEIRRYEGKEAEIGTLNWGTWGGIARNPIDNKIYIPVKRLGPYDVSYTWNVFEILIYDGSDFEIKEIDYNGIPRNDISEMGMGRFNNIIWNHNGSYAFILCDYGGILHYDHERFNTLVLKNTDDLYGVDFHPSENTLLLTGGRGDSGHLLELDIESALSNITKEEETTSEDDIIMSVLPFIVLIIIVIIIFLYFKRGKNN